MGYSKLYNSTYSSYPATRHKWTQKPRVAILKPGADGSHYYPSYSGGRDQEVCDSKSAQANSLKDPISKNHSQK
jgi:hypothetical protein